MAKKLSSKHISLLLSPLLLFIIIWNFIPAAINTSIFNYILAAIGIFALIFINYKYVTILEEYRIGLGNYEKQTPKKWILIIPSILILLAIAYLLMRSELGSYGELLNHFWLILPLIALYNINRNYNRLFSEISQSSK